MSAGSTTQPPYTVPAALQRKWAAAWLGISVDHFDRYVRPHVQPIYVGDVRLWRVADLQRWLDKQAA